MQAAEALARAQQAPASPAPAKAACEEDWCKRALALTRQHLTQLDEDKAKIEADIRRLEDEQAQRAKRMDTLRRQMRADGQHVALAPSEESVAEPALDPSTLPRPGDQILTRDAETALVSFEEAWSGVAADDPAIVQAIAELNQLAEGLDCRMPKFGGMTLLYRHTEHPPVLAADIGGTLRYREQLGSIRDGQQSGFHETEEFAPLSRMTEIEMQPARGDHCARVIIRCRESSACVVASGNAADVSTTRALSMMFMRTDQAQRAVALLGALVKHHAVTIPE